jgi:monofunctional biosynthetic peptidoglycan transglycosylase
MKAAGTHLLRLAGLVLVCALALQLWFLGRVALMVAVDPQSSAFQRSEIWRIVTTRGELPWRQQWVDYGRISPALKRAVIASEDAGFSEHSGVEWDALEKAWERNQKAEAVAARQNEQAERRASRPGATGRAASAPKAEPRLVGGSTISQQLAKNLFLGGERSLGRKAQELVITYFLEATLTKERILEIYLNSVEWGEGVFGAEAAARHYFHVGAGALSPPQAARLAVMLPAPKRFEKRPGSPYLSGRTATVLARMGAVELP